MKNTVSLVMLLSITALSFAMGLAPSSSSSKKLSFEQESKLFDLHQYADNCDRKNDEEELKKLIQEINAAPAELKEAGFTIDATAYYTETPFMKALRVGNKKAAKLLLEGGCSTEYFSDENRTASHLAVLAGDVVTVVTLLKKNAFHLTQTNKNGNTPLHAVSILERHFNCTAEIDLFNNIGHRINQARCATLILQEIHDKNTKQLKNQLEKIESENAFGFIKHFLRYASAETTSITQMPFSVKNNKGETPLDIARKNNPYVLATFIKYGAPCLVPNDLPLITEAAQRCMNLVYYVREQRASEEK